MELGVRAPPRPRPCPPRPPLGDHSPRALPRTCPRTAPPRTGARARAATDPPRCAAPQGSATPRPPFGSAPGTPNCPARSPTSLPPWEWVNFSPLTHTEGSVRTCPFGVRVGELPKLEAEKSPSWAFEHAQLRQPRKGFRNVNPCRLAFRVVGNKGSWEGNGAMAKAEMGTVGNRRGEGAGRLTYFLQVFLSFVVFPPSIHSHVSFHKQRTF